MATLEGARDLAAKLVALKPSQQGRALRDAVQKAMLPTYRDALHTIPVGTKPHKTYKGRVVEPGFAQQNLRLKTWTSKDKQAAAAMVGVNPEAFYVLQFIELGTSKLPPRPWLEPAFRSNKGLAVSTITDELRKRIERIARRRKIK
jgi:HK97 gp10 family phage protein